jgi:5-formyltetrahydrofolate cyclo-ligase
MVAVHLPAWSDEHWETVPGSVLLRASRSLTVVPPMKIDLIVTPGLAFDARGSRLGRGGGFYDRFLAEPQLVAARVGIALDEQIVDAVPTDSWDVSMHAVVTDTRTVWNRRV